MQLNLSWDKVCKILFASIAQSFIKYCPTSLDENREFLVLDNNVLHLAFVENLSLKI